VNRRAVGYLVVIIAMLPISVSLDYARQATGIDQEEPAKYRSPGNRHKIKVGDRGLSLAVEKKGGRLVADYGSYRVYEVDTATSKELTEGGLIESCDDYNLILLNAARIDTTTNEAIALRKPVASFKGKRLHLVQFTAPVKPEWYRQMEDTGVEVVTFIPNNAYLVYGDQGSLERLQKLNDSSEYLQWDGAYLDDYKIDPSIRRPSEPAVQEPAVLYAIQLVTDPSTNSSTLSVLDQLKAEPIRSQFDILNYRNVIVRISPADVKTVAARPDVVSIQPYVVPTKQDERQDQIVAGNLTGNVPTPGNYLTFLAGKGFTQAQFTSSGFAVDVSDSGIDDATTSPNHLGLWVQGIVGSTSRVVYNRLEGTPNAGSTLQGCDGHGTLDAHIVAGYNDLTGSPHADLAGFRYGLGVAPFVRVGSSVVFDPHVWTFPSFPSLQSKAYTDGARISTNSWGDNTRGGYNVDSQAYDALTRDAQPAGSPFPQAGNQQMVMLFANGNAGGGGSQTVGAPATAKNVISVGAAENVHPFGDASDSGADSANDIANFSSRGPTLDGRKKPDIMAPGTHVTGGVAQEANPGINGTALACYDGSGVSGGPGGSNFFPLGGQQFYTASNGTSHSCPAVAGGAALVRQYFMNKLFGEASPAMTKAYLMNSARYMTGINANDTLWSNNQGMGEMNLGMAFDSVPRILRDQLPGDMFTAAGQTRVYTGNISDTTKPFRVTLGWTDAPGSTVGDTFRNDLNLQVTAGGNTYVGNVFTGANSSTGGVADIRNNVESVFIPAGVTGSFTGVITAANFISDGVPNVGGVLDQDFALVIYNTSTAPSFVISMSQATYVNGDTVTATKFQPINPSPVATAVHLRIWLVIPTVGDVVLVDTGSDGTFFFPPNLDQNVGPVSLVTVTASFPPKGNWQMNSRLRNPATTAILYEEFNPFVVN
jgi:hypothetical protein